MTAREWAKRFTEDHVSRFFVADIRALEQAFADAMAEARREALLEAAAKLHSATLIAHPEIAPGMGYAAAVCRALADGKGGGNG